jgi:hypothetical protein
MVRRRFEARDKTKSYFFLTPMLEIDPMFMSKHLLLNSYLGSDDLPEIKQSIFLLYEFQDMRGEFAKLEKWYKNTSYYRGSYDPDKYTTMFYFHVPEKYYNNYLLFLNGKYSQLDQDLKQRILRFHNAGFNSDLYKVLYRDPERKKEIEERIGQSLPDDAEVASAIEYSIEIYSEEHKIKEPFDNNMWQTYL